MKNTAKVVITHHAVSSKIHNVHDVDQWHAEKWFGFISELGFHVGYHYVIEWNGVVTQTRNHHEEGAHTIGMNTSSIGVCFMGNFDVHMPSEAQMKAWDALYSKLNLPTYPHRNYSNKSCHGSLLSDDYFADYSQKVKMIEVLQQLVARLTQLLTGRRMK